MPDQATIYLVRHAHAGNRETFDGDDRYRPLSKKGRAQAVVIGELLAARMSDLEGAVLLSSPYVRCYQTVEPLSTTLDRRIVTDDRLAEGYSRDGALSILAEIADGSVVCSHGDVIPDVISVLHRRGAEMNGAPDWRKGSIWVIRRTGDDFTTLSAIPPPET